MSAHLEFYFDYGSPFSYLADAQLEGLRARTGAALVYRPMLLGGVFKATGNRSPLEEPVANKRSYSALALRRWVAHYGVPFRANPFFPINTLGLMRAAVAAQQQDVFEPFHRAIFPALWVEGLNLGEADVVAGVLERGGVDAKPLLERASHPEVKQALRDASERAVARGVFGAPTFFVGDELFFVNDHPPFAERALSARR